MSGIIYINKLQTDVVDVLIRFRLFRHAFTADIRQMFRQILVPPEFRTFQQIQWRKRPQDDIVEYQLNTVTYGVNCAPYLAIRVYTTVNTTARNILALMTLFVFKRTYMLTMSVIWGRHRRRSR